MRHVPDHHLDRRMAIGVMTGGLLAIDLPRITAIAAPPQATNQTRKTRKSMIVLFGEGGPASQDSFDPKKGSSSTDSFFNDIQTTVSGVRFAEPWKRLATLAERLTVFRAHHTDQSALHALAVPDALQNVGRESNAFVSLADASGQPAVFMHTPNVVEQSGGQNLRDLFLYDKGLVSSWEETGRRYSSPYVDMQTQGLSERLSLLRELNAESPARMTGTALAKWDEHTDRAAQLLSGTLHAVGNLDEKDVRRYSNGDMPTPESLILLTARELIRKEVARVVFVRTGGIGATKFQTYGWDHHYDAEKLLRLNIPVLDHTMAELIKDTDPKNGIIPDTSIVCTMDMGRTPRIDGNQGGRDHFAWRSSVIVSQDLEPGIIGSTDSGMMGNDGVISNADFATTVRGLMKEDDAEGL